MSSKASDKISKLGIKEELQLSVLCGAVSVGGSAKYIEEHKPSKKAVQCSFVQKIRTVDESINIKHVGLRDIYSKTIGEDGTHVVFKISWGANATVTLTYENEENLVHREIQDELKLKLEKLKSFVDIPMLPEESSGNMKSNKILKNEQLNFYLNADVMANDQGAPRTLDEASEFIRNMPQRVKETEKGKGKKLFFHLIPLSVMKKQLGIQLGPEAILCSIQSSILKDLQRVFDELEESDEELRDLEKLFQQNTPHLHQNELARLKDFQHEFNKFRNDFKGAVAQKLRQVRSGQAEIETLKKLIVDHRTNIYATHTKVIEFIQTFNKSVERLELLQEILKNGVHYVDCAQNFSKLQSKYVEMIVLYLSFNNANYELSRKFECQKKKKDKNPVFVFVDVDRIENISQIIPEKELNSFNGLFRYSQGKYSNLEKYSKAEIFLTFATTILRRNPVESLGDNMITNLQEYLKTGPSDEEFFKQIQEEKELRKEIFILVDAFHDALEALSSGSPDTREIMKTFKEKYYNFNPYGQSLDLLHIVYGKDFEDNIESDFKVESKFKNEALANNRWIFY
uniref:SNTX MACPF/CDC-like domain-containing protein n=1 Tax=Acrobeloides nanus TaxID=290746 RepID=A0A914CY18_9BILA